VILFIFELVWAWKYYLNADPESKVVIKITMAVFVSCIFLVVFEVFVMVTSLNSCFDIRRSNLGEVSLKISEIISMADVYINLEEINMPDKLSRKDSNDPEKQEEYN